MRISFILCLLLATSIITQAQKYELPKPLNRTDEKTLVHEGYTCSFNTSRLTPTYVAWCLTRERVNGKVKRTNFFDVDPSVESRYQVRHSDYSGTRFDRGHMCPAADNQHSQKAMVECFYMTNMCPQRHALNSGAWNDLEIQCRSWARNYGRVYICSGPIYDKKPYQTIGNRRSCRIAVPDRFFKVVLMVGRQTKAIGFIYPNGSANKEMRSYAVSVDKVEQVTGLNFFYLLDDKIENQIEKECKPSAWGI
ncbi:MAG: DNA/RNA non-specific endonuclease [Bacteroidaceae bacterium]|jgi:endonuclease G|nr:DNA/RNA non-specific endonuclease [Bacteroidaceae bacterium]MBR3478375.1 DNA/RNA non-specific endonuclease [Bacteroidaceae bacterium]MCR4836121.1 DNA/RNA non-specific endonuclease [Bacteroidaceae bacterium]